MTDTEEDWPALPLAAWEPTRATLHMWTQIVGKVRLALTPHRQSLVAGAALCQRRAASPLADPLRGSAASRSSSTSSITCCVIRN